MPHPTPSQMRALRKRDPKLATAMKKLDKFPGFPESSGRRISHWESLARAITFQQLAGAAATTIFGRVVALTPGSRLAKPEDLLKISFDTLRAAGLSNAKALSITDLANHIVDGRLKLRGIHHRSDEEVIDLLTDVRGIGPWTAQMFLMFKLGRLDVLPSADLGVQEGLRVLDDLKERPTPKELEARGEVWAPLRSVASWMMYRLVDAR